MAPKKTTKIEQVVENIPMVPEEPKMKVSKKAEVEKAAEVPLSDSEHTSSEEMHSDDTDEKSVKSDDKGSEIVVKKERKPRQPQNLTTILESMKSNDIKKAIKLLDSYITKNGAEPKKRRTQKTDDNGEPKPLGAHKLFIQQEMKRLREENPQMQSRDRMREATNAWNEHKRVLAEAKANEKTV
jgi:hypothetical protein